MMSLVNTLASQHYCDSDPLKMINTNKLNTKIRYRAFDLKLGLFLL